jgi:hypothetical protein
MVRPRYHGFAISDISKIDPGFGPALRSCEKLKPIVDWWIIYIIYIYIWTHTSGLLGIFLATNRDVNELSTNCNHLRGLLLVYGTLHSGTTDGQASGDHHNISRKRCLLMFYHAHDGSMYAIYGVPLIPWIYPSHVSIYTSTMDPMGCLIKCLNLYRPRLCWTLLSPGDAKLLRTLVHEAGINGWRSRGGKSPINEHTSMEVLMGKIHEHPL